jgi:hypothetical protein
MRVAEQSLCICCSPVSENKWVSWFKWWVTMAPAPVHLSASQLFNLLLIELFNFLISIYRTFYSQCFLWQCVACTAGEQCTFIYWALLSGLCGHNYTQQNGNSQYKLTFLCQILRHLATDRQVPGSIPGTTIFSEKQWVWNGVHSASWVQLRSYLIEKVGWLVKLRNSWLYSVFML